MSVDFQGLVWEGNSKQMVEGILNAIPFLFRGSVKNSMARWIKEHNVTVVTEDLVYEAVDDIAPSDMAKKIKSELDKIRT